MNRPYDMNSAINQNLKNLGGAVMFFQTDNIDARILSVIDMGWERVNARAGYRPFHSLAYRLVGGASFFQSGKHILDVEEDEITFCPAGLDFAKQAGKGHIIVIHFVSDSPLPDAMLRFQPKDTQHFKNLFLELSQVWSQKNPGWEYDAKILFYRIIRDMERQWAQTENNATRQRLAPALEYIQAHLGDSTLSVETLSKRCAVSDTYLRKLFVQQLGETPQKYIRRLRLERATELLRSGYYSVSEISDRCGFNNSDTDTRSAHIRMPCYSAG